MKARGGAEIAAKEGSGDGVVKWRWGHRKNWLSRNMHPRQTGLGDWTLSPDEKNDGKAIGRMS